MSYAELERTQHPAGLRMASEQASNDRHEENGRHEESAKSNRHRKPDRGSDPPSSDGSGGSAGDDSTFRNRDDELERVLRGITNPGGPHFWLVTAPPQMGKTWFVTKICREAARQGWVTNLLDLRKVSPDSRANPGALLAGLFGLVVPVTADQKARDDIAVRIFETRRPHLCVLDAAELLDEDAARMLRSCLSEIYHLVDGATRERLAFIVASRLEDKWRAATESPRLSVLSLSEFSEGIVQSAFLDLVRRLGRDLLTVNWRQTAATIYEVTEGLPALLARCLAWIGDRQAVRPESIESRQHFEELAGPYINRELLARGSLFPGSGDDERTCESADPRLEALALAYRILAPYRLFTQSHLRNHLENNRTFSAVVEAAGWSIEDLWDAVSGSALQLRPLDEPWQIVHPAIRRLFYRYFYATTGQQAEAQEQALRFIKVWSEKQLGKEQVVGLIECLWHQATARREPDEAAFDRELITAATALSLDLKPSMLYTVAELRRYAADRMSSDDELRQSVKHIDGLFARLVEIVRNPPPSAGAMT